MPTVSDHYTLLLLYFVVFFLLTFVLRSVLVYRRTGINPLVLPRTQDAYGYVGLAFKVLMLLCACTVTALATVPSAPECLGAIRPLEHGVVRALGWLLLMACLVWMLVAQAHMGASWRIGIDSARRTELVRTGLFAVSRNPIFLAVRLALLGLFLVAPNAATAALLAAGEVVVQVQVRLEEKHLREMHGDDYARYCAQVRRWL